MNIIENWSTTDKALYGKTVQTKTHNLQKTGLFTDDALAALLDRHPDNKIDVCTMSDDPVYPDKHCTVDFRGYSGKQLIEAAKAGHIWINIREAMNIDPAYKHLLAETFDDLEECTGQNRFRKNSRGGILISSPSAKVPYHCDPTMTMLWHIRGRKRVYVYPATQKFLPDDAYEAVLLGEQDQDIPYRKEFDKSAKVYDLPDNTLVCWPHTSPHRVENQSYCVSMVMEFSSKESALRNSVMYTNGLLRRHLGLSPRWDESTAIGRFFKSIIGHFFRRIGLHKTHIRHDFVRFRINPNEKNYLSSVPSFIRKF